LQPVVLNALSVAAIVTVVWPLVALLAMMSFTSPEVLESLAQ
jgi:hypothetical protein